MKRLNLGFACLADHLAAVGVGARRRIKRTGSLRQRGKFASGRSELFDLRIDRGHVRFDQCLCVSTRSFASTLELKDRCNFGKRQAGGLRVADELQPFDGIIAIVPVATWGSSWLIEEPDRFVVPNRLGAHSTLVTNLADLHGPDTTGEPDSGRSTVPIGTGRDRTRCRVALHET